MSKATLLKSLHEGGTACPCCGEFDNELNCVDSRSERIEEGNEAVMVPPGTTIERRCYVCECIWETHYVLHSVTIAEPGNGTPDPESVTQEAGA